MIYLTDAQLEELTACSTSACYLLSHFGYLRHPSRGRIRWDLYDWQTDILERLEAGEDIVVVKSRQVGMSWTLAAYGLWVAMLHQNKDVLFVSRTERSAIFLLDKVKYLISNMPEWLTGEMLSETKTLIKFGFRDDDPSSETYGQILGTSVIASSTTTGHAGRGESYAFVLGDEVAFWPDKESEVMWESMKPTLSHAGQAALVSCLTADNYVYTNNGLRQVSEFVQHAKSPGFNDLLYCCQLHTRNGMQEVDKVFNNGKSPILGVRTSLGVETKCTPNHKFWVRRENYEGWINAEDLIVDDFVALSYNQNIFGTDDFVPTADIGYLCGLLIGDGYIRTNDNHYQVTISNSDGEITDFLTSGQGGWKFTKFGDQGYRKSSKFLAGYLELIGFDFSLKSFDKIIPKRILTAPREVVIGFLQGLFDADGTHPRPRDGGCAVVLSSASLVLLQQTQQILLNLGIYSRIRCTIPAGRKTIVNGRQVCSQHDMYALCITSLYDVNRFLSVVGFRVKRKQGIVPLSKGRQDVVPYASNAVKALSKHLDNWTLQPPEILRFHRMRAEVKHSVTRTIAEHVSKRQLLRILDLYVELRDTPEYKYLKSLYAPNIRWVKVTDVNKSLPSEETYDFSVSNIHEYCVNGLVCHNTPHGLKGALFDRIYFEALYNENSFSALKVHWKNCGFDEAWYSKATEGMTKKQILQEYECDFVGSGNPVFDLASVKNCYKPKFVKEKTRLSFTGIDTAEGRGKLGDCHSAVVLNEQGVQIYAENNQDTLSAWAGSIQSRNGIDIVLPGRVSRIHKDFPGPMIIEANGTGMTVYKMHKLPELPNCRLIPRKMTSKSKPAIMTQLAVALESGEVTITDPETFNQLLAYSYDNSGGMNAPSGRHDDLVVALAWAYESLTSYGIVIVSELNDPRHNDADYQMAGPKRQYESVPDMAREGYYTELNPTFFGVEDPSEKFRSRIW